MTKKKRGPNVEELLGRPWCYYCERDFEDLKMLISHQKAKHFKCERCNKRLNTAGGLSVHMNQVHKESLNQVENALPNRQGLDVEIFGMEGVPEEIIQQHTQRILQSFYTAQAERQAATGNPPAGQAGSSGRPRKPPVKDLDETPESIKARLKTYMATKGERRAQGAAGDAPPPPQGAPQGVPPPQSPANLPPGGYPYPMPGGPVPYAQQQQQQQQQPGGFNASLPARPPASTTAPVGLPARPPGYSGPPGGAGEPAMQRPSGDDIDQLIRMAEAGIRPGQPKQEAGKAGAAAAGAAVDKKGKKDKDKNVRMVYADSDVSPEELMVRMPRYARYLAEAQG